MEQPVPTVVPERHRVAVVGGGASGVLAYRVQAGAVVDVVDLVYEMQGED